MQTPVLSNSDRLQQTYVIGATGTGKSTLLLRMILHDIACGSGVCVLDPHGDLVKDVIARMQGRANDIVLLSLTNSQLPFGLNPFHCANPSDPFQVQNTVSTILNIFEKVYGVDRNTMARIINYLQALIYLFIHNPQLTVLDIPSILDPSKESELLRLHLVQSLPKSPAYNYSRYFWTTYYNNRGYFGRDEELAGVFNKFREMTSVLLYPIFCQKNTIDFATLMAQKKIVLCKLNADWFDATSLIGSIIIAQILHAGYERRHKDPFFVYCDEFQNFATYDFSRLFAEARKFNIALTISHQTTSQIAPSIKDTCMQAGNIIVFRVSGENAKELASNFDATPAPAWEEEIAPEWFERVEEEVIDGEEEIRTPVTDVVGWLLSNRGGHSNPVVTAFSQGTLSVIERYKKECEINSALFTACYDALNMLFREAMRQDDPEVFFPRRFANDPYPERTPLYWVFFALKNPYHILFFDREENVHGLVYRANYDNLYDAVVQMWQYPINSPEYLWGLSYLQTKRDEYLTYLYRYSTTRETLANWEELDQLQQQLYGLRISNKTISPDSAYIANPTPQQYYQRQYNLFVKAEKTFVDFMTELKDVVIALVQQPIEVGSGIMRPRRRTQISRLSHPRKTIMHPQRTLADMEEEIANTLSMLPNFTAWIKTPTGEYSTSMQYVSPGVSEQEFQKRVQWIQQQNLTKGYVRKRADVEQEVANRPPLIPTLVTPPPSTKQVPPVPLPPRRKQVK